MERGHCWRERNWRCGSCRSKGFRSAASGHWWRFRVRVLMRCRGSVSMGLKHTACWESSQEAEWSQELLLLPPLLLLLLPSLLLLLLPV